MIQTTLPLIKTKELKNLITKDGEIKVKYLKGHPRQYRFDASRGILNIKGETPVTKPGKEFTIIPIAYRIFKDKLFEYSRREWLELFFIDEKGAIATVMFHGYSVEAFLEMTQELFYEDLSITEVAITVTPDKKTSKKTDEQGKNNTYYIAKFEYDEADIEYIKTAKEIITGQKIYRSATIKSSNDMIAWENFPIEIVEAEQQSEVEEKEVAE